MRRPTFTLIASTEGRFSDFGPYVPAVNRHGAVAFYAAIGSGQCGVFVGNGATVTCLAEAAEGHDIVSHPDIADDGTIAFYRREGASCRVILTGTGGDGSVAETGDDFETIGPLGPTMNEGAAVAFRADLASGGPGVFVELDGAIHVIANTWGEFRAFQGLPLVDPRSNVVFRADRKNGAQGIYRGRGGPADVVVETGDTFNSLGAFPSANDDGTIGFTATLTAGGAGIFTERDGVIETVVDSSDGVFEAFRGALVRTNGAVVFFATPTGGQLGIYDGPGPVSDRLIGIGDPLLGSTVTEFALNAVSLSAADHLAVRVTLADGRQLILRTTL